jgi:hypothetical protein
MLRPDSRPAPEEASVRGEKRLGALGVALFFLFPLVGLFQLGDGDDAWRQVARRTRPSVLGVHQFHTGRADASTATACAVVLTAAPLRAVVAGAPVAAELRSPTAAGWIAWKAVYSDPQAAFTILEAARPAQSGAPQAAGLVPAPEFRPSVVPLASACIARLNAEGEDPQPVPAVLVSPAPLDELPLWVGVLEATRTEDGRPGYRGTRLRELAGSEGEAAAAPAPPSIHPALQGAPFVTREGVVVALFAGTQNGVPQAVPMGLVRRALERLPADPAR